MRADDHGLGGERERERRWRGGKDGVRNEE